MPNRIQCEYCRGTRVISGQQCGWCVRSHIAGESAAKVAQFVAAGVAVMQGLERVAVARSHNFAKRIARALNNHKVNSRGY